MVIVRAKMFVHWAWENALIISKLSTCSIKRMPSAFFSLLHSIRRNQASVLRIIFRTFLSFVICVIFHTMVYGSRSFFRSLLFLPHDCNIFQKKNNFYFLFHSHLRALSAHWLAFEFVVVWQAVKGTFYIANHTGICNLSRFKRSYTTKKFGLFNWKFNVYKRAMLATLGNSKIFFNQLGKCSLNKKFGFKIRIF